MPPRRLDRLRVLAEDVARRARRLRSRVDARADRIGKDAERLRTAASAMRLVPANALAGDLERGLRDAAKASGKRVELRWRGGDIRIDAHVLSALRGALTHLVRNAVAHGIEDAADRAASGKPEAGTVEVEVRRRGHRIALSCRDDGRGIDLTAVGRLAVARGLLSPSEAAHLDMGRAATLLLGGGISTTASPTQVSGRGVGLDAVRAAVVAIGGDVRIESEPGRGTRVELIVPLSLSALPALAVEAGGVRALVPLDAVASTLQVEDDDVVARGQGELLVLDGGEARMLPLDRLLGAEAMHAKKRHKRVAVIVRTAEGPVALVVDRVAGVQNAIVRSLPREVAADPIVAGTALSPRGLPQLVLATHALGGAPAFGRATSDDVPRALPILIVDDSLTTRMLEQSILESAGYEVDLAVSAEEALDKARSRSYGLFLVDVEMPGMNGFELVASTRADPVLREVPAILVTSLSSAADRERGLAAGAHDYVVKSEFDQEALLETIRRLVGEGR